MYIFCICALQVAIFPIFIKFGRNILFYNPFGKFVCQNYLIIYIPAFGAKRVFIAFPYSLNRNTIVELFCANI